MRVVTVCGSHHSRSTNAVALDVIARRLAAAGIEVTALDVGVDLPSFRPEAVDEPPAAVQVVRDTFRAADGVAFATPEYAGIS